MYFQEYNTFSLHSRELDRLSLSLSLSLACSLAHPSTATYQHTCTHTHTPPTCTCTCMYMYTMHSIQHAIPRGACVFTKRTHLMENTRALHNNTMASIYTASGGWAMPYKANTLPAHVTCTQCSTAKASQVIQIIKYHTTLDHLVSHVELCTRIGLCTVCM